MEKSPHVFRPLSPLGNSAFEPRTKCPDSDGRLLPLTFVYMHGLFIMTTSRDVGNLNFKFTFF